MTALLTKASAKRQGLVAVKRTVRGKTGKSHTQTFWVRKDEAPKSAVKAPPAPSGNPLKGVKGPLGDSRVYLRGAREPRNIVRIPDKAIKATFSQEGRTFVVHAPRHGSHGKVFVDSPTTYALTEVSTGLPVLGSFEADSIEGAIQRSRKEIAELASDDSLGLVLESVGPVGKELKGGYNVDVLDAAAGVAAAATDTDRKRLAAHIATRVFVSMKAKDRKRVEADALKWLVDSLDEYPFRVDIDSAITDLGRRDQFALEIAFAGNLSLSDAKRTASALKYFANTPGFSQDDVLDWWEAIGRTSIPSGVPYSDMSLRAFGQKLSHAKVVQRMLKDRMEPFYALSVMRNELDELYGPRAKFKAQRFTYRGVTWTGADLDLVSDWVKALSLPNERKLAREHDKQARSGKPHKPSPLLNLIETRKTNFGQTLFRGTNWDAWLKAKIGDKLDLGIGSFSTKQGVAEGFARSGEGSLLILEPPPEPQGIDVWELARAADKNKLDTSTNVGSHRSERECIVRSPKLEVIEVFRPGDRKSVSAKYNVVRVRIADAELSKAQPDAATRKRLEDMYLSFNDPLSNRFAVRKSRYSLRLLKGKAAAQGETRVWADGKTRKKTGKKWITVGEGTQTESQKHEYADKVAKRHYTYALTGRHGAVVAETLSDYGIDGYEGLVAAIKDGPQETASKLFRALVDKARELYVPGGERKALMQNFGQALIHLKDQYGTQPKARMTVTRTTKKTGKKYWEPKNTARDLPVIKPSRLRADKKRLGGWSVTGPLQAKHVRAMVVAGSAKITEGVVDGRKPWVLPQKIVDIPIKYKGAGLTVRVKQVSQRKHRTRASAKADIIIPYAYAKAYLLAHVKSTRTRNNLIFRMERSAGYRDYMEKYAA